MANTTNDLITNERPLYKDTLFFGREDERGSIEKRLEEAERGRLTHILIEFFGTMWLGKTWLLKNIASTYDSKIGKRVKGHITLPLYIDLMELEGESDFAWYHYFLSLLVKALMGPDKPLPAEFQRLNDKKPDLPLTPDEVKNTLANLTKWFQTTKQKYFPILLIDSTEYAPAEYINWLEREIFLPLVQDHQALIIVAGRHPINWREPDIRFNYDLHPLGPFTPTELERLRTDKAKSDLGWIHEHYALGHPGMGSKMYEALGAEGNRTLTRLRQDPESASQEVKDLLTKAIKVIVLDQVPTKNGVEAPIDLQELIWIIAPLRLFNPEILQLMAQKFGPKPYHDKKYMFFRSAVFKLIEFNIAQWSSGLNDYRIAPLVRRIVANAILVVYGKAEFIQRHEFIKDWYIQNLKAEPSTAPWKIPEILYHTAVLASVIKPEHIGTQVLTELDQLLKQGAYGDSALLDKLTNRLKDIQDPDLQELHQDLEDLAGSGIVKEIIQRLDRAKEHD